MFCLPKKWLFPSPATCAETPGFVLEAARRWHIFRFSTIPIHGFCFQVFLPVAQSFFFLSKYIPPPKKTYRNTGFVFPPPVFSLRALPRNFLFQQLICSLDVLTRDLVLFILLYSFSPDFFSPLTCVRVLALSSYCLALSTSISSAGSWPFGSLTFFPQRLLKARSVGLPLFVFHPTLPF